MSNDPKFDHIDLSEKQKVEFLLCSFIWNWQLSILKTYIWYIYAVIQVLNECVEAEAWLRDKRQQQDSLPKHASPVLLSAETRKKAESLDRYLTLSFLDCEMLFLLDVVVC